MICKFRLHRGSVLCSALSTSYVWRKISHHLSHPSLSAWLPLALCLSLPLTLLLLLSHFSRVQLCVTPQTAHQAPTRLPHPWDSPGKNTGMGCYFLLKCMKVKSESEAAPLCPTPSDPRDCSLPGSSVHGIFQARVMEWVAISLHSPLVLNFFRPVVLSLFVGCCIYKECAICMRQVIFFQTQSLQSQQQINITHFERFAAREDKS